MKELDHYKDIFFQSHSSMPLYVAYLKYGNAWSERWRKDKENANQNKDWVHD